MKLRPIRLTWMMMSYLYVVRYLRWKSVQLRDEARSSRLIRGAGSEMFAEALEHAADTIDRFRSEAEREAGRDAMNQDS